MSFFISDALAQAPAQAPQDSLLGGIVPLVLIFVVFYFLLIRPQTKRAKEHRKMVEELSKGDEVVTNGGLLGRITQVGENFVQVKVADNVEVKVQKQAIASLMPKGTSKEL
ncbi:MAG TPA: preprotein translocase subunit YajC [Gammaproteobacteria bacterium]|nr:preprotein translocase subunit YajC [Gammaproteobacteria bacterium]